MTIYNSITELVGRTPIIKLNSIVPEGSADVYVKLEAFNPGSSVKDRIALRMIEDAEKVGAKTAPGKGMLLWQGAAGYQLWTGQDMPVKAYQAFEEEREPDRSLV